MQNAYHLDHPVLEAGVDEAGRGSLLGRMYVGAVIFEKNMNMSNPLNPKLVKDSKKFTSRTRRKEAYDYILDNCLSYGIAWCEASDIDDAGLSKSLTRTMHNAIRALELTPEFLIIDGNYFEPYFHPYRAGFEPVQYQCVAGADNSYYSVAAASILAKVAHDEYIEEMVEKYPILREYNVHQNMGYGAKQHIEMLKTAGPTEHHRRSFCSKYI